MIAVPGKTCLSRVHSIHQTVVMLMTDSLHHFSLFIVIVSALENLVGIGSNETRVLFPVGLVISKSKFIEA